MLLRSFEFSQKEIGSSVQAEEHHGGIYEYGYMNEDDSGDDDPDYGTTRKKRAQKRQKARVLEAELMPPGMAKTQEAGRDGALQSSGAGNGNVGAARYEGDADGVKKQAKQQQLQQGDLGYSATGRRKRKDTGATRTASRAWSDEEEERFKEALSMFGRDWKKCAEHIGTRDARAVASHTQKFLIKALLRGEELPEAMARSGRGYTLSGKPLDPNSSAARAYGLRPKEFLKIVESGFLEVGVHVTTFEVDGGDGSTLASPKQQKKKVSKSGDDEVPARSTSPPPQPTEYALNRPRRTLGGQKSQLGDTTESLDLTDLQEFMGPIGAEGGRCQPFAVTISEDAVLVMDFHAHLSSCEVIGLLGGTFDTNTKQLVVKGAYPCRRTAGSDSTTSVELDPASQVIVKDEMATDGLIPVGWYHSHPIFEARPSAKDNENQRNYQAFAADKSTGLEPWVGMIIGPYDEQLPTPASHVQAWVVRSQNKNVIPYNIRYQKDPPKARITPALVKRLESALENLVGDPGRLNMQQLWRPFTFYRQGLPEGPAMKRSEKLRAALNSHLPIQDQPDAVSQFHQTIDAMFLKYWGTRLFDSNA